MQESILKSVKEVCGLSADDPGFDSEFITHINAAFAVVQQLGVTLDVYQIEDDTATWSQAGLIGGHSGLVRSYINLKVQSFWDPPNTSFLIDLKKTQLAELEVRLNLFAEVGSNG